MGNWKNRLLRKHNLGKLVLGQFLIVFAILLLDPYPVHDVYYWEVGDRFSDYPYFGLDEFRAGTNPLNGTVNGSQVITIDGEEASDVFWVNTTWTIDNLSINDDEFIRLLFLDQFRYDDQRVQSSPWVDIGSVELDPGDYDVWVLYPAKDDGRVNYRVFAEDNTHVKVVEPDGEVTRKYGRLTLYLDCTFTIDEAGRYDLEAYKSALDRSFYMAVMPERSLAYPILLALGWLLILQVVTIKSYQVIRRWTDRTKQKGLDKERFVFPPDVAYFFAMGPEPNWKGPAFFRAPRGTAEFFRWRPMDLEFPVGTAGFFALGPGAD